MKTLSVLFIAVLLSFSAFCRVRTGLPVDSGYTITGVRIVDSVLMVRFLVTFDGVKR